MSIGCIPFLVVNYPQFGLVSEKKRMISMSDQKSRRNFMKSQSPSLLLKSHEMMKSPLHGSKNRNLQGPPLLGAEEGGQLLQAPGALHVHLFGRQQPGSRHQTSQAAQFQQGQGQVATQQPGQPSVTSVTTKKKMSQDSLDKVVAKNIQKLYSIRCEYY